MSFQRMITSGSCSAAEQLGDRVAQQPVAFVLQLPQGEELLGGILEALEQLDRFMQPRRGPVDHVGLLPRLRRDLLDLVGVDVVGCLVDVVAHVVDHGDQAVHVVAVERRDERPVQEVDHLARQPVALVLGFANRVQPLGAGRPVVEQLDQEARDLPRVRRSLDEEREELALLRHQAKRGHLPGFYQIVTPASPVRPRVPP